jgi:hypothetical protein
MKQSRDLLNTQKRVTVEKSAPGLQVLVVGNMQLLMEGRMPNFCIGSS